MMKILFSKLKKLEYKKWSRICSKMKHKIVDYVTAMEHLGRNFAIEFPFERHQEFFKDCNRVKRDKVLKKRLMSLKWKFNGKIESQVIHSSDIFFFLSRKKSSSNCTFGYSNIANVTEPSLKFAGGFSYTITFLLIGKPMFLFPKAFYYTVWMKPPANFRRQEEALAKLPTNSFEINSNH